MMETSITVSHGVLKYNFVSTKMALTVTVYGQYILNTLYIYILYIYSQHTSQHALSGRDVYNSS